MAQNEAEMDPMAMIDSLNTLTYQLALCGNQPSVKIAQALTDTQKELANLKEQIAELNKTVVAISDRTQYLVPDLLPAETPLAVATRAAETCGITWTSVGVMDTRTLKFVLSILGRPTVGSDNKLRTRLRNRLGLKPGFADDKEPCEEPIQDNLVLAAG